MYSAIQIKASILSEGVQITESLLNNFGPHYLEKRRAYGNGDPLHYRVVRIPQELYIHQDGQKLVAAVNIKEDSTWSLHFDAGRYWLSHYEKEWYEVSFPLRPDFYTQKLSNGKYASQVITLYGGGSLGIFAYGTCHLVEIKKPCHYCSISQNRSKGTDFVFTVSEPTLVEALQKAIVEKKNTIRQVMLNGGNFPDMDKSFIYYVNTIKSIAQLLKENNVAMESHLIVYPPKNLDLLKLLENADVSIAMNTEVFNKTLFNKYCPGKVATSGREHILQALECAAEVLGKGRVYSIFVGGLEPVESLAEGLHYLSEKNVTPIVNVLHTDPETPLEHFPNPTHETIMQMGKALQDVFTKHQLKPFYENCGRNSIDTEAYQKLFV